MLYSTYSALLFRGSNETCIQKCINLIEFTFSHSQCLHIIISWIRIFFESWSSISFNLRKHIERNFLMASLSYSSNPAQFHFEMLILHFIMDDINAEEKTMKLKNHPIWKTKQRNTYIFAASFKSSRQVISLSFNFSISVLAACFALPMAQPR